MTTRGTGRKPLTTEERRAVGIQLRGSAVQRLEELARNWGTSKAMSTLYCVIEGANVLAARMGQEPVQFPDYLVSQINGQPPLFDELHSRANWAELSSEKAVPVFISIPMSRYEQLDQLAGKFGMPTSTFCGWTCLQHLNVLLDEVGAERVSVLSSMEKKLPTLLLAASGQDVTDPDQDVLVPAMASKEGERLAS